MSSFSRSFVRGINRWRRPIMRSGRYVQGAMRWGFAGAKNAGRIAALALAGVRKLKGLVNSEMYRKDTTLTGTVDSAGSVTHLTAIAQGDGEGARTGNSLYVRAVNWTGQVSRNTAGNTIQTFRLMVFQDTQQITDSAPGVTDVLQSATVYSHLNANTVGRFKILRNKVITMSSSGSGAAGFKINIPMRHHVRYNGSASSDIQRGGLYVLMISDQASTNLPSIQSEVRVSYHDN